MFIPKLSLSGFRNYTSAEVEFCPGVNVVMGDNAQGKTSLLEAVNYLATFRSFRTGRDSDLINFSEDRFSVSADVDSAGLVRHLEARLERGRRREILVGGKRERDASFAVGILRSVLFSPEDLYLVKSVSLDRRRFLDNAVIQLRPKYALILAEYRRIFEHKRALLQERLKYGRVPETLDVFNQRLCEIGAHVIRYRASYIETLEREAMSVHDAISCGREQLALAYVTDREVTDTCASAAEIAKQLETSVENHMDGELASGKCLVGPHKDDIEIKLCDMPAKTFGSQGQIRTAALSLKIGERNVNYNDTGEYPILLLDDVLSELDAHRREYLLSSGGGGQIIITSCERDIDCGSQKNIYVENGRIVDE